MKLISIFLFFVAISVFIIIGSCATSNPVMEEESGISPDSVFMVLESEDYGDGTGLVTFGSSKSFFDEEEGGYGYEGNLTPKGWGTQYPFTGSEDNMYTFTALLKDNKVYEVRIIKSITNEVVVEVINAKEAEGNKYYNSKKDIFIFRYKNGEVSPLDSMKDDNIDLPYSYGDENTADWVVGFTESENKDKVTIFCNLSLTGETTGFANLINKVTGGKIPLTVHSEANWGSCQLTIASIKSAGLLLSFERNGVEIPLVKIEKSEYYNVDKKALWVTWTQ